MPGFHDQPDTVGFKIPLVLYTEVMKRLTRAEQSERNRGLVLAAARRVFLARGYHGATLEQIADEAGFSKGVVYSQFESKADLFLALLEARISERAAENARVAASVPDGDLLALIDHFTRGDQATPGWQLLVIEFRVHAARDAGLSRRYAAAMPAPSMRWPASPRSARGAGRRRRSRRVGAGGPGPQRRAALEQAADPDALGGREVAGQTAQVLEPLARLSARFRQRDEPGHDRGDRALAPRFPPRPGLRRADLAPCPAHVAAWLGRRPAGRPSAGAAANAAGVRGRVLPLSRSPPARHR